MKILIPTIYILALLSCPLYWGYKETGTISLSWSFLPEISQNFEK